MIPISIIFELQILFLFQFQIITKIPSLFRILYHFIIALYNLLRPMFTIPPSSKYHTTLFKVPYHPLQSTIPPFSKYHTTLFKVPYHPLQSTIPPSSKYHILYNLLRHGWWCWMIQSKGV